MVRYSAAENLRLFIKAGGLGFLLGFLFLLKNFFANLTKKSTAAKAVFDFAFMLIAGTVTFLFLLSENNGMNRWFVLLGEGIGFLCFCLFPGQVASRVLYSLCEKTSAKAKKIRMTIRNHLSERKRRRSEKKKSPKKKKKHPKKINKTIAT